MSTQLKSELTSQKLEPEMRRLASNGFIVLCVAIRSFLCENLRERVSGCNPVNVALFFNHLKDIASRMWYEANSIWNMDETGVTTVHKSQ